MNMVKNNYDNISDSEIRVLGSTEKTSIGSSNKHGKKFKNSLVFLLVVLAVIIVASVAWRWSVSSDSSSEALTDTLSEQTVTTAAKSVCTVSKKDTTINDIPLSIIIPKGGVVSLIVGKLPENDKSVVLAAQAADLRDDKDLPTGAFVCKGELISKGHSKYGFCAILGNEITLGRQLETPLFEKAVEENGSFFRQYSLVSNGTLMEIPQKGKSLRRALCLLNKDIVIIESKDRESYHDFSQSLVDLGVKEGLALVGGEGVMMYRMSGKTIKEGSPLNERKASENYIIWK